MLELYCKDLLVELNRIYHEKYIVVDNKVVKVKLIMVNDYACNIIIKSLKPVYTPRSVYKCMWCYATDYQIEDMFGCRSLEEMKQYSKDLFKFRDKVNSVPPPDQHDPSYGRKETSEGVIVPPLLDIGESCIV